MKIISIILTLSLLLPVITCSLGLLQMVNSGTIAPGSFFLTTQPVLFYGGSYLVFMVLSALLNLKGKFAANIVLSCSLILIYFVTIHMVNVLWLK